MNKQSNLRNDFPTNKQYYIELNKMRKKLGLPEFHIYDKIGVVVLDDYHFVLLEEES